MANGVAEASWLRQLLTELRHHLRRATLVYCDNVSAVYLFTNPVQHQRTKHVEIDLHFVQERVALGQVWVLHVPATSSTPTSSPRVSQHLYFRSFDPVVTFVLLPIRLRESVSMI